MATEIIYSGGFTFKDGSIVTNGDVYANAGNTIEFFSTNRFAIFIKGRIRVLSTRRTPPFGLKYVRGGSPAKNDKAVFASKPKDGKQRVFINLKATGIGSGDHFPYGVAMLVNDVIEDVDPQIIIL